MRTKKETSPESIVREQTQDPACKTGFYLQRYTISRGSVMGQKLLKIAEIMAKRLKREKPQNSA